MKKAVVYGAGNIGRGFIGQLSYKSGFSVTFIDVNPELLEQINHRRQYPLKIVSNLTEQSEIVQNVSAVNGKDEAAVISALQTAEIVATAVGVANLDRIVKSLAKGIQKRINDNLPPINILVCENMIGANLKLKQAIQSCLPEAIHDRLELDVGFVEVSVGRMVPPTESAMKDPLLLQVEPYEQLPYDASCWRGAPILLHGGIPCEQFGYYIKRKLFVHNLGHAVAGYFGFLKGCHYIHEAMSVPSITALSKAAMEESGRALNKEFPDYCDLTIAHIDDLLFRFGNSALADPVMRICADPLRKLGPDDRLVGAMRNCLSWNIACSHILSSIAVALLYNNDQDDSSVAMRTQIETLGLKHFLKTHCRIDPEETTIYTAIETAHISVQAIYKEK